MKVYVLTILDECNDIHDVSVYHEKDRAIKEIVTDLKDRFRMYDDEPYASDEEFDEIVEDMKSRIEKYGQWSDDTVYYIVDEKTVK